MNTTEKIILHIIRNDQDCKDNLKHFRSSGNINGWRYQLRTDPHVDECLERLGLFIDDADLDRVWAAL